MSAPEPQYLNPAQLEEAIKKTGHYLERSEAAWRYSVGAPSLFPGRQPPVDSSGGMLENTLALQDSMIELRTYLSERLSTQQAVTRDPG